MTPDNRRERIAEIDQELPKLAEGLRKRQSLRAELSRRFEAIGRPRDRFALTAQSELEAAISQLDFGFTTLDGYRVPELQPFEGKPGIEALERRQRALTAERARHLAYVERWPTAATTRPHRYTGAAYKATLVGRELMPGDIVDLTEAQARAFADRFEPVEAEPVAQS